jgi:hypothetical protein
MGFHRITFAAGLACGYVAGTAAGRERYDQMVKFARTVIEHPKVQQAATTVQAQATGLASNAAQKVSEKAPQVAQSAMHSVGEHIPGVKHNHNGSGNGSKSAGSGGKGPGKNRPFPATSSSHPES